MPQSLRQTMPQLAVRIQTPIRFRTEGLEEHTSTVRRRYWKGFVSAWEYLSPELLFAGFFFAEIGAETIFNSMRQTSKLEVYRQSFQNITRDETRHLGATMALLRAMSQEFTEEQKLTVTRQMKQGFIFLSPLLYEHKSEFWRLPSDFDKVDHELEQIARDSGLGCLTM